ncbi:MAG: DNA polymerase/3'-5' exonuclease PolX [Deltaproteobacteria bacterium]|nr:DNA polymerase/3'-5' exonuclease PolX [Deltaproteobacteria bacterium]
MVNDEIAHIFNSIADILELKNDNQFRIRAYRKAALVMNDLADDADKLLETGKLSNIPGIGKDLSAKIEEYVRTGKVSTFEELKKEFRPGLLDILSIPGVGPKPSLLLYDSYGIDSIEKLETYANTGRLKGIKGIKDKTIANILKGIALRRSIQGRFPLGTALPVGEAIMGELRGNRGTGSIELAGSIRRRRETVGDIDILVTADDPGPLMDRFVQLKEIERVLSRGPTRSSAILKNTHMQVDVRVVEKDSFGAALAYFTGSKAHNIKLRELAIRKGYKLNEYGVFDTRNDKRIAGATEQDVYDVLGLQWVPPEIREDQGEIELAIEHRLPELIADGDILGDVHMHTVYSDGDSTIGQMARHAGSLGYRYIAITDHSQSLGIARGLDPGRLRSQMEEIDAFNETSMGIRVLKGMEVDILSDGRLDMDAGLLDKLDIVIGSIHMGFKQPREQMTGRMVNAMKTGLVDLIGHPSGRIIGERDAYEVDWDTLFDAAKKYRVAMEINSFPLRLDLTDVMIKKARSKGLKFMTTTDSHDPKQMRYMGYGVSAARRGWLGKHDVVNTKDHKDFVRWLKGDR